MNLRGALVIIIAAAGLAVSAQQRPSPQTPAAPVFRTGVQYVSVDVVVTDKDDKPVTDLTKDDFVITERDKPQKIADFAFVSIPLADRPVDLDAPVPPPSDVAVNVQSSQTSRAIVLVIDDLSIEPQDLVPLKRVLAEFLKTLSPDDQVALTYTRRSDLSHDFTNDFGSLIAAVNNRKDALGLGSMGSARFDVMTRIRSLKFIVNALAASRHTRRAIVFITAQACIPFGSDIVNAECRDVGERARRADVPIYTLDPRLFTDAAFRGGIGSVDTPEQAGALRGEAADDAGAMKTLSAMTGGRAFAGMSDPLRSVREVMVENGSYYLLGYYPDPIASDGKFHDIKVKVTRPGFRVRARPGYMAGSAKVAVSTPTRDMTAALGEGIDDPSLPIRAFAAPLERTPKGTRTVVTIEVAYPVAANETKSLDDELRVGILALSPDAKIKASFQRPIKFTGTWKPTARGTFIINEVITLPDEKLSLRVGVRSRALGKTGTAHIYVTVPDFSDNDLQLTQLALGTPSSDSPDAAVGIDLIRPLVPFQPTTWRVFKSADVLRVFARALWKGSDSSVNIVMTVTGREGLPAQSFTVTSGPPSNDGHRDAIIDKSLSLKDLVPGSYVLRVEARQATSKPFVRELPVEIK